MEIRNSVAIVRRVKNLAIPSFHLLWSRPPIKYSNPPTPTLYRSLYRSISTRPKKVLVVHNSALLRLNCGTTSLWQNTIESLPDPALSRAQNELLLMAHTGSGDSTSVVRYISSPTETTIIFGMYGLTVRHIYQDKSICELYKAHSLSLVSIFSAQLFTVDIMC